MNKNQDKKKEYPRFDWPSIAPDVAMFFWGKPNPKMSDVFYLRWGEKGTKRLSIVEGVWFDDEKNHGGGVIDLVFVERGKGREDAIQWLAETGFFDDL